MTVGTAEVNNRTHPRNVMVCDDYVAPQWVRPLERTWESAETDVGELLRDGDPGEIIADDERHRASGGGAVRRLLVVHLVRSFEGTLVAHQLAQRQGVAAVNDPVTVAAWREVELRSGGLLLPPRFHAERAGEAFEQHVAHGYADQLPALYGKTLAVCVQHSLEVAIAPEGCEFVLGDTPAFTARPAADGSPVVGLGEDRAPLGPGTMLAMPIGPTLCALLLSSPLLKPRRHHRRASGGLVQRHSMRPGDADSGVHAASPARPREQDR